MSDTPRTDGFEIHIDMQDLDTGHKLREWKAYARKLEMELGAGREKYAALLRNYNTDTGILKKNL